MAITQQPKTLLLIILLASPAAFAAPAIQPGDIGLRHDIQVLADYGVIRGPVSTWPLSWDAIATDLRMARDEDMILPVAVEQVLQRMLLRAERAPARDINRRSCACAATAGSSSDL